MTKITLSDLRNLATGGDARAQYALAGLLSMRGEAEEANKWLQAAADQDEPDALYTIATRSFYTKQEIADALDQLARAVIGGSTAANRLFGALKAEGIHVPADWEGAVDMVITAAKAGDPFAKREIAMLLLSRDAEDEDGAALINDAAESDAIAAAISVCRVIENRSNADGDLAEKALQKLEQARYPNAASLREEFSKAQSSSAVVQTAPDWLRVKNHLGTAWSETLRVGEQVLQTPTVKQFHNAFSREECEYLIGSSVRFLAPSMIVDPLTGQSRADPYRNSLTATLGVADLEIMLVFLNRRIAQYAEQPEDTGEFLSILLYSQLQEYRPHFDWLPEGAELDRSGQRTATVLVYLNGDYDGGETHFVKPDFKLRGEPGDLIVFHNVDRDGVADQDSQHAGLPVRSGAKWLASKWFRAQTYDY